MINLFEWLLNTSEAIQIAFVLCCVVGLIVMYRFRKYVAIIGLGFVFIYNAITGKEE